jgi:hypothetical protein
MSKKRPAQKRNAPHAFRRLENCDMTYSTCFASVMLSFVGCQAEIAIVIAIFQLSTDRGLNRYTVVTECIAFTDRRTVFWYRKTSTRLRDAGIIFIRKTLS